MLCNEKQFHVQWRDFKMNVLVCDDERQIVDSIIETLEKKTEETQVSCRPCLIKAIISFFRLSGWMNWGFSS